LLSGHAAANHWTMAVRISTSAAILAFVSLAVGCISTPSEYAVRSTGAVARINVCHGFGCHFKSELNLGAADARRLLAIMAAGATSAKAERAAVSRAVRYYEDRAAGVIGVRDEPKSNAGQYHRRGQMDCVDESTNTRSLLLYLERRRLLRHHTVDRNVTRGFLIDGRYPHATAVLRDKSGKKWAIDSWYEPAGDPPDIRPLSEWLTRGVMGVR
jgi:hypothetical protein